MFPKKAHSAIICGPTGCGKTEYALNLLETEYKGFFKNIIVICPTLKNNKAYMNRPSFFKDDSVIAMDYSDNENSDDWLNECFKYGYDVYGKQDSQTLFIIDNCCHDDDDDDDDDCYHTKGITKKNQMLSYLAFSGSLNCSVWVFTQQYDSVLSNFRSQTKWTALFWIKDKDSFDKTLRENDIIPSLEEKKEIEEKLAKNQYSKLILITEPPVAYWWEPAK